jgi:hypothetical protein
MKKNDANADSLFETSHTLAGSGDSSNMMESFIALRQSQQIDLSQTNNNSTELSGSAAMFLGA